MFQPDECAYDCAPGVRFGAVVDTVSPSSRPSRMMIDVPSDAPNFTFTVANESPSRLLTWPEASLPATAVTGRIKASTRRARPWAAPVAASCSLPGPGWISTSVLPLSDVTRTLAFRPPRKTPTDCGPFFRGARGVLVDLHARGVHGEHPNLDGDDPLLLQCREQALHRAVPGPAVEPPADGDPLAIALRQIPPRSPVLHIHSRALTNL